MATNFPTSLDTFSNPTSTTTLDGGGNAALAHASQHSNLNDAVEALQAAVGITGSAVATSLQYKLTNHIHAVATASVNGFMSTSDKSKLDAIDAGATNTPLSSTVPLAAGTANVGTSTSAARADHVHPAQTFNPSATSYTWTAAQRGEVTTLTSAASIALDLALSNNYKVTLGVNATLANPTNIVAGQSGAIAITQDATGSRTLAYGSYFKFPGGTIPSLTTTAAAVDVLLYYVESTTRITAVLVKDVK